MSNSIRNSFAGFLDEEGIREEVEVLTIKQMIIEDLKKKITAKELDKNAIAKYLNVSRFTVDRFLSGKDNSCSFMMLVLAAKLTGKKLRVEYK